MQNQYVGAWIKGFYKVANYALKHGIGMEQQEAKRRWQILKFWEKYGIEATIEAFGVKRRTLFDWKKKFNDGNGQMIALNNQSRKPHRLRKRQYPIKLTQEIRRLRKSHHNIGKEKIHILLKDFSEKEGIKLPSVRTIGRLIKDAPDKMRVTPLKLTSKGKVKAPRVRKKPRIIKPKGFKAAYPGHCVAFDSIERFVDGTKRYLITCIDLYSRFSFALCVPNHSAKAAETFLGLVKVVFPIKMDYILTDNGSEFQKEFDETIRKAHEAHWHTYPKTPKMNAHDERFNRTIQEEFVDYHEDALLDPGYFNDKLLDYLLWYNGKRPHWGIDLLTPIQVLGKFNHECNMSWPNTHTFLFFRFWLEWLQLPIFFGKIKR